MADLIDSHCHLTFDSFDDDREDVIRRAREAEVVGCLVVAVDAASARLGRDLSRSLDGFCAPTVGIHPNDGSARDAGAFRQIEDLAASGAFVAVGETGLDTYRDHVALSDQVASLERHLRLALDANLPVVLHCRDAFDTLSSVIAAHPGVRGVLHCYTGGPRDIVPLLEAGLHIGVGGIVTFKSSHALREALAQVPDERLLVETDAPFRAPMPVRGRRNEPASVRHVAEYLAPMRGLDLEELAALTTTNARDLFGLAG